MKRISMKTLMSGLIFGALSVGTAWAGGNGSHCIYGGYSDVQAEVPPIESSPILADAGELNTTDPKWLAELKRERLEADSQKGLIAVPN